MTAAPVRPPDLPQRPVAQPPSPPRSNTDGPDLATLRRIVEALRSL